MAGVPSVVVVVPRQVLRLILDGLRQDGSHLVQLPRCGDGCGADTDSDAAVGAAAAGVNHVVGGGVVLSRVSGHASIGRESHADMT